MVKAPFERPIFQALIRQDARLSRAALETWAKEELQRRAGGLGPGGFFQPKARVELRHPKMINDGEDWDLLNVTNHPNPSKHGEHWDLIMPIGV